MATAVSDGSSHYRSTLGTGRGSFRGVPFLIIDDVSQRGGQRVARREFPLRSDGGADSLGSKMRERTFRCVVLGTDYMAQRDTLIAALDASGQGALVHPYWGSLDVVIESWSSRESLNAQGRCDFTITCLPPLSTTAPIAALDSEKQVKDAAGALTDAAKGDFGDAWSLDGLSLSDINTVITGVNDKIQGIEESVKSMLGWVDDVQQTLSLLAEMKANIENLINLPADLAQSFEQAINSIQGICDTSDALATYKHMGARLDLASGSGSPNNSLLRLSRHQEANQWRSLQGVAPQVMISPVSSPQALQNLDYLDALVVALVLAALTTSFSAALTEAVQAAEARTRQRALDGALLTPGSAQTWLLESQSQAQAGAVVLAQSWEQAWLRASTLGWPDVTQQARLVRLALLTDTKLRAMQLPRSEQVTATTVEPALVLVYRHTGDCRNWQTMARRNDVIHPLFVPAGLALEVLV